MSLPTHTTPPPSLTPYHLGQLTGESMTIPGSKGVFRMLASSKQTDGAMAVFTSDAVLADAPGFHYHNQAHDVFIVTKGYLKLWNGERCLTLGPGDFASVPPGIIHNPHGLGPFTQTLGLITPGDWVDFFRHVSEPFTGLLAPQHDNRDLKSLILPKVMAAKDRFDVVFVRPGMPNDHLPNAAAHNYVPPQEGTWGADDEKLPEGVEPYYLKSHTGPRWMLGGVMSRPMATTTQSGGKFAISAIESSDTYATATQPFAGKTLRFKTHHVFYVLEGALAVAVDGGEKKVLRDGETAVLPAGTAFSVGFESRYVRFWSFASGDGIEAVVHKAGESYGAMIIPDEAPAFDAARLQEVAKSLGVEIP